MAGIFGNGTDGDVTVSSNVTLTVNKYYNNLTINNGITLDCAGYKIRVKETLLNYGTIIDNSQPGGSGASQVDSTTSTGANGGNGNNGTGLGGRGGDSGASGGTNYAWGFSGWGYCYGGVGGAGGTGGKAGGRISLYASILNNQGIINGSGGNGSNGSNGGNAAYRDLGDGKSSCSGGGGGGQGGGGGGGGRVEVIYSTLINKGTILFSKGIDGSGGNGGIGGSVGSTWSNRNNGYNGGVGTNGSGSGGHSSSGVLYHSEPGTSGKGGRSIINGSLQYKIITDSENWNFVLDDGNFASVWNNTDILKGYRCQELEYSGSGNCEVYKIIDFGKSVAGISFNINGYIKILSYVASAIVNLKYEWLDSTGTVISSHSIAALTANQEYTKSYVLGAVAPAGTQKVKIRFYCSGSGSVKTYLGSFSVDDTTNYGLEIQDGVNLNILTPKIGTIISCGTVTMPNSLNGDGTYGLDIDLPGTDPISVSDIGVFILPHGNITWEAYCAGLGWASGDPTNSMHYIPSVYLDDDYVYYTKDSTTGVMTAFTPGAHTASVPSTWDAILSIFPIVGWDRVGETLTSVRLWAATCYVIADGLETMKAVYSIGNTGGITSVDYAVFLKNWNF